MNHRDEDDAYDYWRQREIDEAAAVQRALFEGKDAGRAGLGADANHYGFGTPENSAWERGRADMVKVAA